MLKKINRWPALAGIMVYSAGGYILRRLQLAALDPAGLPDGTHVLHLVILCAAAVLFAAGVAFSAEERTEQPCRAEPLGAVLLVLAAVLLASGNLLEFSRGTAASVFVRITTLLGVLSGLCFAVTAFCKERKPAVLWLLPIVYYVLQLIFSFKLWSTDPIILDYCFKLFALIFTMLGVYRMGGYAFSAGRRRISLFFTLCGVFFCAVTLADGGTAHLLQTGGGLLYLAANAYGLMKN